MKKIILASLILLGTINTFAQYSNHNTGDPNNQYTKKVVLPKSNIGKAGFYLKKSSNYQCAAIICGVASTGMFLGSTQVKDKFEINKDGDIIKKTNSAKNALLIGGSLSAFAGMICEFYSMQYKFTSGKYLLLEGNSNGAGLAYVF